MYISKRYKVDLAQNLLEEPAINFSPSPETGRSNSNSDMRAIVNDQVEPLYAIGIAHASGRRSSIFHGHLKTVPAVIGARRLHLARLKVAVKFPRFAVNPVTGILHVVFDCGDVHNLTTGPAFHVILTQGTADEKDAGKKRSDLHDEELKKFRDCWEAIDWK